MFDALPPLLDHAPLTEQLVVLGQVLAIDLVLAGDNAVAVGMAAAGLDPRQRRAAILAGLGVAVVLRIGFAVLATQLLTIIGLTLAGGLLLLWVCWKMWRDLRAHGEHAANPHAARPAKGFASALLQIMAADLSMSLDNVLAVAGAARDHPALLVFGLLMSIALMGVAASWIARILNKHRWVGYLGLLVVVYVALHMIWDGHRSVVIDMGEVKRYNAYAPDFVDITPDEIRKHRPNEGLPHKPNIRLKPAREAPPSAPVPALSGAAPAPAG